MTGWPVSFFRHGNACQKAFTSLQRLCKNPTFVIPVQAGIQQNPQTCKGFPEVTQPGKGFLHSLYSQAAVFLACAGAACSYFGIGTGFWLACSLLGGVCVIYSHWYSRPSCVLARQVEAKNSLISHFEYRSLWVLTLVTKSRWKIKTYAEQSATNNLACGQMAA